ncbi:TlpA family protein disulfide reductase [Planctomycetota bacterium]|nr:TlpA family protein disulfide reductase [Planctomycetota bacterium]
MHFSYIITHAAITNRLLFKLTFSLLIMLSFSLTTIPLLAQSDEDIPTYNLIEGQLFTWESQSRPPTNAVSPLKKLTVLVLDENSDDSYDLLITRTYADKTRKVQQVHLTPQGQATKLHDIDTSPWFCIPFPELSPEPEWEISTYPKGLWHKKTFSRQFVSIGRRATAEAIVGNISFIYNEIFGGQDRIQWQLNPKTNVPTNITFLQTAHLRAYGKLKLTSTQKAPAPLLNLVKRHIRQYNKYHYSVLDITKLAQSSHPAAIRKKQLDKKQILRTIATYEFSSEIHDLYKQADDILLKLKVLSKRSNFVNITAPPFSLKDIDDLKTYNLQDNKGKVVLLYFWLKNRKECLYYIPSIEKLAKEYQDKPFIVLGMNVDEDPHNAIQTNSVLKPSFISLQAFPITKTYNLLGYPAFVLIDQNGTIKEHFHGTSPAIYSRLDRQIKQLFTQPDDK